MTTDINDPADLLQTLLARCTSAGASDADARLSTSEGVSLDVREGKLEGIERAESQSLSLRCFFGQRMAHVSGSDLSPQGLSDMAERCVAMARAVPEDPYCGIAPAEDLVSAQHLSRDLDLDGVGEISDIALEEDAIAAEAAALAVPGVKQCSGCGNGWSRTQSWLAATNGFAAHRTASSLGLGLAAIAEKDGKMERDYESRSARYLEDRPSAEEIGRIAGERTVARLGARKIATQTGAVIYDRRLSSSLLSSLIGAISGPAIARGVSFLKDRLGEQVFAKGVSVLDDPFRLRGMSSRLHDGEGRPVAPRAIIEDGVLTEWLLNGPSARQLGLTSNGYASTAFGDPPGISTSNITLQPGKLSPAEMMKQAGKGLLVTDMFGPSINPNTGDYSVGVSGFWFEGGEIAHPVSEVTIAGDLPAMFARLIPASDLEIRGSRDAPSLLIEDMAIAGD
ncbi:MAG: metallopeptidase TldD-related protein [Hyphomonadaceae bacterium]|nr:metallopeptidase TldD-related protein [Hyphomonadaceae bacterium]